jgi:hypothetical protein
MEESMKNLFFAALAALILGFAAVPSYADSTAAGNGSATPLQQSGAYGGDGNS